MIKSNINFTERVVSAISYLTMGWGGLLYLILLALKRREATRYIKFNSFQSIFLSFVYFILAMLFGLIFKILSLIPYLNYLVAKVTQLIHTRFFLNYSLIQVIVFSIIIYTIVFSLLGRYPRIYGISKIIDRQVH